MHKYERHLSMSNQVKTRSLGSLSRVRYLWHDSVILTQIASGCFTLCCLLPLCSGFLPFPVGRFSLEQIFVFSLLLATLSVNCISLFLSFTCSVSFPVDLERLERRVDLLLLKGFFFFQLVEEKWTRSECVEEKRAESSPQWSRRLLRDALVWRGRRECGEPFIIIFLSPPSQFQMDQNCMDTAIS